MSAPGLSQWLHQSPSSERFTPTSRNYMAHTEHTCARGTARLLTGNEHVVNPRTYKDEFLQKLSLNKQSIERNIRGIWVRLRRKANTHQNHKEIPRHPSRHGQNAEPCQHQVLARTGSCRNCPTSLAATQNGAAPLEDGLVISYKTKRPVAIRAHCRAPRCFPQGAENLHPRENLHTNVYGSFIPSWEPKRMLPTCPSAGKWINGKTPRQQNITQR